MVIEFRLRTGMKNKEILEELHGRVAGETRQQYMLFERQAEQVDVVSGVEDEVNSIGLGEIKHITKPRLEVVMDDPERKYALMIMYYPVHGSIGKEFILAGINDEGTYFVRPLTKIPEYLTRSFDLILSWVNKVDLGYTERVQGDIVMQFMPKKGNKILEDDGTIRVFFPGLAKWKYRLPENGSNREFTDPVFDKMRGKLERINFGDHQLTLAGNGRLVTPNVNQFYALEPIVIDASAFVMEHPEHGQKHITIPAGHYAVLASQRGRDVEITAHGVFD